VEVIETIHVEIFIPGNFPPLSGPEREISAGSLHAFAERLVELALRLIV
jgi:hypothetical protein